MDFDLSPLGERRPRLPLQRKVKQLQRPWQHADSAARAVPRRIIWATSQQDKGGLPRPRPQSGAAGQGARRSVMSRASRPDSCGSLETSRRRPATGLSIASSGRVRPRIWEEGDPPSPFDHSLEGTKPAVRWDGTASTITSASAASPGGAVRRDGGLHPGGDIELVERLSLQTTGDGTLHSSLSAPSFFMSVAKEPAETDVSRRRNTPTILQNVEDATKTEERSVVDEPVGSCSNASSVLVFADSRCVGGARRPFSADASPASRAESSNILALRGEKIKRPQTASIHSSSERCSGGGSFRSDFIVRDGPLADRPSVRGGNSTPAGVEGREHGDTGSSVGGRVSVEVMLPLLEKGKGATDARFRPGSSRGLRAPENSEARDSSVLEPGGTLDTMATEARPHPGDDYASREGTLRPTQPSYTNVLGYFIKDSGHNLVTNASLHGRALPNHRRSQLPPPKRPHTPALVPGKQPPGVAHPLSPTSMGSPPRFHRNSNWGEEGVPLALEEKEKLRNTVPFVVSGTMLGWKLSTRGRKKMMEESLKTSDYSEHHLIPVYGFRCTDDSEAVESNDRRVELRRVEARALLAERAALERRARAEGGTGGAAFARAMSRRALAKADWIQKVGDVVDVRKENMCRGSSPEVVRAYRKCVRDRLHGERLRRRTERGLPIMRPQRISAVTCRADLAGAAGSKEPAQDNYSGDETSYDGAPSVENGVVQEFAAEPYLMLVRARHRQEVEKATGVPFCAGCLGGCKGTCSPSDTG